MEELRAKELAAETKFQTTVAVIRKEVEHGIWTTAQVAKTVQREHGLNVSTAYIARTMKKHCDLSYT